MDALKVSELAGRSDVPASTVRVHDQEGLLPARRSPTRLEAMDRQGPCDPSCTYLGRVETVAGPVLTSLPLPDVSGVAPDAATVACALDAADREQRARHWRDVLAAVSRREPIPRGVRLTFDREHTALAELAELAASEVECCRFFALALHVGPPVQLDARATEEALVLVHELFGEPDA